MAHVELSLSETFVPQPSPSGSATDAPPGVAGMACWIRTVNAASEPCLVIDAAVTIVAASGACHDLLNLGGPGSAVGRFLLDGAMRLVDFTAARDALTELDAEKIPPLLALSSGRLARGLMRVYDGTDLDVTVDAIATPLREDGKVVGSLTFFAPI